MGPRFGVAVDDLPSGLVDVRLCWSSASLGLELVFPVSDAYRLSRSAGSNERSGAREDPQGEARSGPAHVPLGRVIVHTGERERDHRLNRPCWTAGTFVDELNSVLLSLQMARLNRTATRTAARGYVTCLASDV